MRIQGFTYLMAFLIGGGICLIAQIIYDRTKLTMGHILVGLVILGGILGGLGVYDRLIEFAGGGASMPITSFGNSLVKGAISEAKVRGPIGVLTGMFELTSSGIAAAIVFSFIVAMLTRSKG
jgi:stage V sporulation protein AE